MERLTFVDEDGQVLFDNPAGFPEDVGYTIRELAENEELETLDNIAERLANCEQRLKYYDDLEKQGKLLKLPCAVGDTVYAIMVDENNFEHFHCGTKISELQFDYWMLLCFGESIFLTKEEAEAALEKLSGDAE